MNNATINVYNHGSGITVEGNSKFVDMEIANTLEEVIKILEKKLDKPKD